MNSNMFVNIAVMQLGRLPDITKAPEAGAFCPDNISYTLPSRIFNMRRKGSAAPHNS